MLLLRLLVLPLFSAATLSANGAPRVDHVLLGVPNLERAQGELEAQLGVRPVAGGKHPGGTHNALIALGPQTYLEVIALQPGKRGADIGMADLESLTRPEPLGWAVSAPDAAALRGRLEKAGFTLSALEPGSRTTPDGAVLHWQTFGLAEDLAGAPFFIVWSLDSPHPATTSPVGCSLSRLEVALPKPAELARLVAVLGLDVRVVENPKATLTLTLRCPSGERTFESTPRENERR